MKEVVAQLAAIKNKEVDYVYQIPPEQFDEFFNDENNKRNFAKVEIVYTSFHYIGFNLRKEIWKDKALRMAISYAHADMEKFIKENLKGRGERVWSPNYRYADFHNNAIKPLPYDPKKAEDMLAEAGWYDSDGDGILDKDGKPFAFELLTNQGNEERKKIAEITQASLRELGIAVDVRVLEWAAFLKEYIKKRRFEVIILGWGIGQDPDQYDVWHSTKTGPDELKHIGFQNPEVDALLEKGRSSCVQQERKQYYDRLQEVLAEEQPIIFLYFRDALPVVATRVHGIQESPNGIRYKFHEWFVPQQAQRYTSG
jgi:peptide/nickel transport system substrate-binding protein